MAAVRVVRAERAWIDGAFRPAEVRLADGVITEILPGGAADAADVIVLAGDEVLLPGLVDSHVHLDEPGRTDWEGFATGTAAAAAGGITTVFDMPLNSVPVTTTPEALAAKRAAAMGKLAVDVGYWGGAVPENLGALRALADAGVVGFKCFLVPSGIDEFGHLDAAGVRAALRELAAFDGLLIAHAEDEGHLHAAATEVGTGADGALGRGYDTFLRSRPPVSEEAAIATVIDALAETGGRGHIVHVSDGAALELVRQAKADGIRLTIETCPHYLTLAAEDVPDGASAFKCCPPIRGRANQDLLWEGVVDGTIDAIVSDHSPATLALKTAGGGDFGLAWGGIAGVQTGFASAWTEAARRGISLESLLPLFTTGPARIAGVPGLGEIRVGARANLTIVAPQTEWTVDAQRLLYRHKLSPWDGRRLRGVTSTTIVGGEIVYRAGDGDARARPGIEILMEVPA
ncbi:MAG: allantoinase AllB [Microbacterium sp.]|uniref:allantoinase AllB n=1 Tax=Microbacterium sp. TaxID=51671 RepID=UPI001AC4780B|nr:allantoinase AllB [Microbacterium sp.]MBN9176772.1 allantoinase AllB [Microbacterium sp.]